MKGENKINELFSHSDNEDAQRISDAHPVFSEAKKDELYKRIQDRVAAEKSGNDFADKVTGVEVRHGHGIMRYIGIAAALAVLIGGIGGGHYLIRNNMNPDRTFSEIETEESTETSEVQEATEETEEEPVEEAVIQDFDMSTQIGVFGKMLNSIDYYDYASGVMIHSDTARNDLCTESTFNVDLTTGKSLDVLTRYNIYNDYHDVANDQPLEGEMDQYLGVFDVYCDGTNELEMPHDSNVARIATAEENQAQHRTSDQLDPQTVIDYMNSIDIPSDADYYTPTIAYFENGDVQLRGICSNTRAAFNLLEPGYTAVDFLYDFSTWDITNESFEYAGRDCVVLEGTHPRISAGLIPYRGLSSFTFVVDKATGCLLKMQTFDTDGELIEWMVTKDIRFDADAEPVPEKNLEIHRADEYFTEPEINTNSHGETYGSCNGAIVRENYDKLPDLIYNCLFYDGGGYFRKDDLFEAFGDQPEDVMKRYAVVRVDDGEPSPAGTDIKIYDEEGENVLFTLVYYQK